MDLYNMRTRWKQTTSPFWWYKTSLYSLERNIFNFEKLSTCIIPWTLLDSVVYDVTYINKQVAVGYWEIYTIRALYPWTYLIIKLQFHALLSFNHCNYFIEGWKRPILNYISQNIYWFWELRHLCTCLKFKLFFKPMTGLKFFVNTTKSMTKFMTHIYDKSLKFKPKPLLRPFVNTGPEV